MEKTKEITVALDGLAECGHGLVKIAEALKRYYAAEETAEPPKKKAPAKKKEEVAPQPTEPEVVPTPTEENPPEAKPEYTKEYVRKLLADIANNGHRDAVKDIIQKHGASSLSAIDPAEYAAIVKEAEVLGSA